MAVMYKIVEGEKPRLPDHFNTHLQSLFLRWAVRPPRALLHNHPSPSPSPHPHPRMLEKDPLGRPSAADLLQDTFVMQHMEAGPHNVITLKYYIMSSHSNYMMSSH